MTLYDLIDIRVRFGALRALDIERLTLSAFSPCALLGPNGSGKTTLLNVLALLLPPAGGSLRFMNETVVWRGKKLLSLRRKVVLVDQHPIMFSTTVLKNVAYGLKMRGESRSAQKQIALECLDRVGMIDYAGRLAHRLSGGETQRVAIARALACRPEVLLLDEPTAGVDIENQTVVETIIADICREKKMSVLFSTHNPLQAERLADRKVFLNAGRVATPVAENRIPVLIARQHGLLEGSASVDDRSYISINPERIKIYEADSIGAFQDNRFPARVLQVTGESDRIRVVLDLQTGPDKQGSGILLNALIPADTFRNARFIPGDKVRITF